MAWEVSPPTMMSRSNTADSQTKGGESSETLHDPDTGTRLIGVPLNRRGKDHVAVRQSIQSRCRRLMGDSLISLYIGVYFHRNHCKPPGLRIRKLVFSQFHMRRHRSRGSALGGLRPEGGAVPAHRDIRPDHPQARENRSKRPLDREAVAYE